MEEASIAFSVDAAAEASDEEEDDIQRKEELHQLLTEQLQDDLLDDSVSTVTTEDGVADSTILGDEVDVSLDHVMSPSQSCDLAPSANSLGEQTGSTGRGFEGRGLNGRGLEVSDVFSGTAQAYSMMHPLTESNMTSDLSPQHSNELPPTHTHQEVTSSLERGRGQLEVLYGARCREVGELTQHLQEVREEGERQERVLRHEKSVLEERVRVSDEEREGLEREVQSLSQQLSEARASLIAFSSEREEMCTMIHPPPETSDVARRLVELSSEKEDLQYQLSCCQGQLETQAERAETAEAKVMSVTEELSSMATEVSALRSEVRRLTCESVKERERVEMDKRQALEKCRKACLQLHEDSSQRMKETMATERASLIQEYGQKMTVMQAELASAREEYVRLCGEKEKVEVECRERVEEAERERDGERERRGREGEREVREAVERAREKWREALTEESRQSVEQALSTARLQWQARLSVEKAGLLKREGERVEAEVTAAVEVARVQWQASQEEAIQVQAAAQEARRECLHSTSEPVLTASQVHSMLQSTVSSVKRDVRQMLQEVLKVGEEREREAAARARLTTAQEMKTHYLNCLHMMVNTHTTPPGEARERGNHGHHEHMGQATGREDKGQSATRGRKAPVTARTTSRKVGINQSTAPAKRRGMKGTSGARGKTAQHNIMK